MSNKHIGWQPSPLIRASVILHGAAVAAVIAAPGYWLWALGAVMANQAWLTLAGLWPRSRWLGTNIIELPARAAAKKQIAITIDDGPDAEVTPQVLDILDRHKARATFFCIGEKAQRQADLCREISRRGHSVENHTQHHAHTFAFSGMDGFRREIAQAQASLTQITGRTPSFFRAPAGLRNPLLDPVLSKLKLRLVTWTRRGFDTRSHDPAAVSLRLLKDVRAGAILLLHDGHCARTRSGVPVIIEVLPVILRAAAAAGLHCVTLAEAMQAELS